MPLYKKMRAVMEDVNREVAEREDVTEAIAVALLTRTNLFILGKPGQAKSYIINRFRTRIEGARQFTKLMTQETDEEQVFGRPDLSSLIPGQADPEALARDPAYQAWCARLRDLRDQLIQDPGDDDTAAELEKALHFVELARKTVSELHGNEPRLITKGKVPDAEIVFLDELFKAGDGILDAFLTAFNERVCNNEGQTIPIPTISFFAASNEIPDFSEKKILEALYDRLDLKLVTDYIADPVARLDVLQKKEAGTGENITATVTLDELLEMQREVTQVVIPSELNEIMDKVLMDLRGKDVFVTDRTYFGYYRMVRAMAWLRGAAAAAPEDMMILRHCLWKLPEERSTVTESLTRLCVSPVLERIKEIYQLGRDALDSCMDVSADTQTSRRMRKFQAEIARVYDEYVKVAQEAQTDDEVAHANTLNYKLEEMSKKAHEACGFSWVPMSEIYSLQRT